jgi:RNA polymerase sigma-70 factor (ECF subfamily)
VDPVTVDAEVYAEHAPRLMALAASLAGPSSAEDVVAAAVLSAITSRSWPNVDNHGAYLTRAVVNEVRTAHRGALRREARERRYAIPEAPPPAAPDPVPEVLTALAALSIRQRTVVFLTYWSDLDPATVANELAISEGSVRKHLARARAALRKELR